MSIQTVEYEVCYPKDACNLDQNEEWFDVVVDGKSQRLRLHDYDKFFEIPGLYEEVMVDHLRCCSPRVVCTLLEREMNREESNGGVRVLDFGAGNGMVAECFAEKIPCETLVGVDIIPEARDAAWRDRPEVYDDYYVMDLSRLDENDVEKLEKWRFNTLLTVAALGYGDIPAKAFINAFNTLDDNGWVAFNIKDRFLSDDDETGYSDTIESMMGECLDVRQVRLYRHRFSLAGDPLRYYAVIGRKQGDVSMN